MSLPTLTKTPTHHPHCCLSLSTTLKSQLASLITSHTSSDSTTLILSIGSGTGIFETLLQASSASPPSKDSYIDPTKLTIQIEGVEVPDVNSYLPPDRINIVPGTWSTCSRANDATGLLFVYPRSTGLVGAYVNDFMTVAEGKEESKIRFLIWLGPKNDWEDFAPILNVKGWNLQEYESEDVGLVGYEVIRVLEKT